MGIYIYISSLDQLVQGSTILCTYMPLGTASLLLAGTVSSIGDGVSVWVLSEVLSGIWFLPGGNKGPFWKKLSRVPHHSCRSCP